MKPWLHAHPGVLITAIIILAAVAVVIVVLAARLSRPHTGHHQAPARKDPVWDDDEPADTWAGDIAADIRAEECADPAATADVRSAWARQPARTVTTDRPPWDSAGFPAWQPGMVIETVDLPPYEIDFDKENDDHAHLPRRGLHETRTAAHVHVQESLVQPAGAVPGRHLGDVPAGAGDHEGPEPGIPQRSQGRRELPGRAQLDLPGPDLRATQGDHRAGKPRNTWTGLLGRPDPQNLPGPASARTERAPTAGSLTVRQPAQASAADRAGEPDVLEGVVVDGPPPVTLGYIEGLALSPAYYQRLDQIGAQARVLALEAAA